ncbi:MAG: hypothetical protein N3E45_10590 [Oscillatoriaceae bacterium SKW80]|nr:hypothetical protein [Oscillatoriaceae bacterium SKYG93]MCX8121261.1 hypothetical protein [Oscillatoriaceae bacterium SKW80]MDW8453405.1 hypothetical protein [Oscillatoriaceae cyanobacterium SKYGB_i_bin93]HIK26760.1 hypothetical protein [Oscillatoriaceae cyanobacterium M7585_C2015_266]
MSRRRRYSGKSQSLIAARLVQPRREWVYYTNRIRREVARLMRMPLEDIYDVRLKEHQLWVSYRGADGKTCSTFFSYRRLPLWQELVVSKICACRNRRELARFSVAMRWEYRNFCYPIAMREIIDETLDNQGCELDWAASAGEAAC